MYLANLKIENFRCFGEGDTAFQMPLKQGLTALVGENEAGKTAVIDALRFALGTTDQEWYRLEDSDFHKGASSREIRITCKFSGLTPSDKRAFVEHLTYGENKGDEPALYVNWTGRDTGEVRRGRPYRRCDVHSGKDGNGPALPLDVRDLLRATYLRPLRDAEQELSAGRGSRLSQVLLRRDQVMTQGEQFDPCVLHKGEANAEWLNSLSVLGIGDLASALLERQTSIVSTRAAIDKRLSDLDLTAEPVKSQVRVTGGDASEEARVRQLLEKLDLYLEGRGRLGLGSNNLLFIACELLLLSQDDACSKLLLIEEPEAHLHAQRQLRVMKYLQQQASKSGIQIIVTTHSPNLASVIELGNMVMIREGRAFSMAEGKTKLEHSDYRFLQRFLDVTKANMFFARGVMIVEGDAENILLPTLAKLIGRDLTEHGVSIVNVGGVGLRRYARIFQRKDVKGDGQLDIPVACVADMDVMPNCAPLILGKVENEQPWPAQSDRRWRAKKDIEDEESLRRLKREKASDQFVKTFVSDEWTLEYDLALGPKVDQGRFPGGLGEDVFVAACLAERDEAINAGRVSVTDVEQGAAESFAHIKTQAEPTDHCTREEVVACKVYAKFVSGRASKAVAAQYLAQRLEARAEKHQLTQDHLRNQLPRYLTAAIDYVTGGAVKNGKQARDV